MAKIDEKFMKADKTAVKNMGLKIKPVSKQKKTTKKSGKKK